MQMRRRTIDSISSSSATRPCKEAVGRVSNCTGICVNKDVRDILIQDGEYGTDEENKEDYAMWLPPENQSGDGVTKLNARFAGRY